MQHMKDDDRPLRQLWWLRNLAIVGQALVIAVVHAGLQINLPLVPLMTILGVQTVWNLCMLWRLRQPWPVRHGESFGNLVLDVFTLAALLYFTGGASNPFASLFILQVMIAAMLLPPRWTWGIAALSIVSYSALMVWNVELPFVHHHHLGEFFNLHIQGMWLSFVLLALLVGGFVVRMRQTLLARERALVHAEQLLALGALATTAAHELSTPLSTLAALADAQVHAEASPEQRERATVMREQVRRCKDIIRRMALAAGVARAESGNVMPLRQMIDDVRNEWRACRPDVAMHEELPLAWPDIKVVAEYVIQQSMLNLLHNAYAASPQTMALRVAIVDDHLHFEVIDEGKGFPDDLLAEGGITQQLPHEDGMGMGLYLAQTIMRRLGGALRLRNRPGGGASAMLVFPLRSIAA